MHGGGSVRLHPQVAYQIAHFERDRPTIAAVRCARRGEAHSATTNRHVYGTRDLGNSAITAITAIVIAAQVARVIDFGAVGHFGDPRILDGCVGGHIAPTAPPAQQRDGLRERWYQTLDEVYRQDRVGYLWWRVSGLVGW